MFTITVYRTYFLTDEIVDGDYYSAPNTYTTSDRFVGHAAELARIISDEGLSFAATGTDWAANPDGSYTVNYATGQECEVTAHFVTGTPDRIASAIMRRVG